jgi:hypothetical protein
MNRRGTDFANIRLKLFRFTFVFNGSEKALADDYAALNYNGHVYVPIRFVAENKGASVNYDEQNNAVTVDYATAAGFPLKDPYADFVRFGNVKVTAAGPFFSLTFYDDQGDKIGSVSPGSSIHLNAGEIKSFELAGDGDFSNYAHLLR